MWWLVPAALSTVGTIVQTNSAKKQNADQLAINQYNANAQYNVSMNNINSQYTLGMVNAGMAMAAAGLQSKLAGVQLETGRRNAEMQRQVAYLNADLVSRTVEYNNALLDEEMSLMWESMDLDLLHLANQRAVERGQVVAKQANSGTIIGEGSNADVIVDQRTQEALDAFVVRHNADISASRIRNKQAQNSWQGESEFKKIMWEGQVGAYITEQNAAVQAFGTQMGAASTALQGMATAISAGISRKAGTASAQQQYQAGMYNASQRYDTNNSQITGNFINGLFGAASAGVSGYYSWGPGSQPTTNWSKLLGQTQTAVAPASTLATSSLKPSPTTYKFSSGYEKGFSLAEPGGSLWGN